MIRQIKYFHSVVQHNSFTKAAEECHISQSAISQQIHTLENALGFRLFDRKNRAFDLTAAGAFFYKRTLILLADYERICNDAAKIANNRSASLYLGYLRSYSGTEFHSALAEFAEKYPNVNIEISCGNHEELYKMLSADNIDLVLSDQRRAFSDAFVNLILTTAKTCIEISAANPITELSSIAPEDLKHIPCILVASKEQRQAEYDYYNQIIGFQSEVIYAEDPEKARLMVICGKGFMPVDAITSSETENSPTRRIPLESAKSQTVHNYCAFWKKDNSGYYIEEFAEILKKQFVNA